jgi:adenylosuccinate synthase
MPITPIYKTLKGWNTNLENLENFEQLPIALANYIRFIEDYLQVPIKLVSYGSDRKDTLHLA